jgi:D-aspartate ligase
MHHGGLGVIRSLGRVGVPVYGVHEGPWAPAAGSKYLAGRFFWHPGASDVDRVLSGLLRLAERIGRPSVLLTTDDEGAIFLAEHGEPLRESFLFPQPPPGLPRQLAGKFEMHQLCERLGVPSPRTVIPDSPADAREFAASAGYPLIAKLTTPWAKGGSLRSTQVIMNQAELDGVYQECEGAQAGLMLQQFIPRDKAVPDQDWFVHGYCDAGSDCRPAFTGVKRRSYPASAGLTCLGYAVANDDLRDRMRELLHRIGYRGMLDLDLRLDPRTGEYNLLDFNPRLGAQFRVFRDSAGTDVALAAYLDLTGQEIPDGEQVSGRGFLVENYDPISALASWRRGELTPRDWMASLRSVDETAWFARDDLRPFGLMCLRMGWRAASRPFAGDREHAPDMSFRYRPGRAGRRLTAIPREGSQP